MCQRIFSSLVVLMFALAFSGCGGGDSSNTNSDKVWYTIGVSIPMNDTAARSCKGDVDVFADACSDGTFLIDHTSSATFTLTRVDPDTNPGSLFLESYTVQYLPMESNSPVIPEMTVFHTQELKEGDNAIKVEVMDVGRKNAFEALFTSGQQSTSILPAGYNADYTFKGHNSFGQPWSYRAQAPIFVGEYNECVPCN